MNSEKAIQICEMRECTGCGACTANCPVSCIIMTESKEGFLYPHIDDSKCLHCKKCIQTCPNNKLLPKNQSSFYMGWHKDIEVLKDSSSGGAFTAIADLILNNGGVVYGAYFDKESRNIEHIAIEKKDDLPKIRMSKYYQGSAWNTYASVKESLKTKCVLFSGTACQIAGLYSYLNKDYDNLITVDVLCHGVAGKKTVDAYIKSKERKYRKKIDSFRFRVKPEDSDWYQGGGTRMRLDFADGSNVVESKDLDTFFVGFNSYLFLRESCYRCKYTGTERVADFTLADYWGVPLNEISERERRYGVSLILANSEKAKKLIESLSDEMVIKEIDPTVAAANNLALRRPGNPHIKREKFFDRFESTDFDRLVHKCNRKYYIKRRIKMMLHKIMPKKH